MSDDFDPYREWLQIEPHEQPVNHYRLLGIAPFTNDLEAIRSAADRRMNDIRRYQMGKRGSHTQPILNALAAAKLCLLNPNTKATYDAVLEAQARLPQRAAQVPALEHPSPLGKALDAPPLSQPPVESPHSPEPPTWEPPLPEPPMTDPPAADTSVELTPVRRTNIARNGGLLPLILLMGIVVFSAVGWGAYQLSRPSKTTIAGPSNHPSNGTAKEPSRPVPLPPEPTPVEPTPTELVTTTDAGSVIVQQEGSGRIQFPPSTASLNGGLKLAGDRIDGWATREDRAVWDFHLTQPGAFRLRIEYISSPDELQGTYRVLVADRDVTRTVRTGDASGSPVADEFTIAIRRGGDYQLELIPAKVVGGKLFELHSIELQPIRGGQ